LNLQARLSGADTLPEAIRDAHRLGVAFVLWNRSDLSAAEWDTVKSRYLRYADLWFEDERLLVFRIRS
jgi:hypothetical protein